MNHKTDMQAALQACVDVLLHDGVPIDPTHPRRVALAAAEAALASRPDAQADERYDLLQAAINCPHEIESNRVVLHYSDKQPGHNALAQLRERLARAAAPAPVSEPEQPPAENAAVRNKIAAALHYPDHWDDTAYPTLDHAAWEAIATSKLACSECAEQPIERGERQGAAAVVRGALEVAFEERDDWLDDARRAIRVYAHACRYDKSGVPAASAEIERLLAACGPSTSRECGEQYCGCPHGHCKRHAASAPTLSEAIYQHDQGDGFWKDVPYAEWQLLGAKWRRVVYTAPAAPQPQAADPKGLTSGQQETIRYAAAILDQEAYHKTANDLRALLANGE